MKIVKAMKKIARLKGEVRELKKRMSRCLNTLEDNEDFVESYKDLEKELLHKITMIINLKSIIMKANIDNNMFSVIVNLGELKSYMEYLKELEPKSGFNSLNDYSDKNAEFKSQLTIKEKNDKISECQKAINDLTDLLDDFNATTNVEFTEIDLKLFE